MTAHGSTLPCRTERSRLRSGMRVGQDHPATSASLIPSDGARRYLEDGFVVVSEALGDADLAPVRATLSRFVESEAHRLLDAGTVSDLYAELPFTQRLLDLYRPLAEKTAGWNTEVLSKEIYDFAVNETILDIAEALVGPELQFNGDYWVRTKLPGDVAADPFPWHQDSGYYGAKTPFHILWLWVPLVDVGVDNGCLQMIKGSHRWGLLPINEDANGYHVPVEDIETRGEVVTLPMKAGDVLAFHNMTFHRSLANKSQEIRWSIDMRYSEIGQPLEWLDESGRTGFVARSRSNPASVVSWEGWRGSLGVAGNSNTLR